MSIYVFSAFLSGCRSLATGKVVSGMYMLNLVSNIGTLSFFLMVTYQERVSLSYLFLVFYSSGVLKFSGFKSDFICICSYCVYIPSLCGYEMCP